LLFKSAKSSVNIDASGSSTPINHLPSLKQEDVDVVMNPDLERNGFSNYRNSESATPPRKPCLFSDPLPWPHYFCQLGPLASLLTVFLIFNFHNPVSDDLFALDGDANPIQDDPLDQDPHPQLGKSPILSFLLFAIFSLSN